MSRRSSRDGIAKAGPHGTRFESSEPLGDDSSFLMADTSDLLSGDNILHPLSSDSFFDVLGAPVVGPNEPLLNSVNELVSPGSQPTQRPLRVSPNRSTKQLSAPKQPKKSAKRTAEAVPDDSDSSDSIMRSPPPKRAKVVRAKSGAAKKTAKMTGGNADDDLIEIEIVAPPPVPETDSSIYIVESMDVDAPQSPQPLRWINTTMDDFVLPSGSSIPYEGSPRAHSANQRTSAAKSKGSRRGRPAAKATNAQISETSSLSHANGSDSDSVPMFDVSESSSSDSEYSVRGPASNRVSSYLSPFTTSMRLPEPDSAPPNRSGASNPNSPPSAPNARRSAGAKKTNASLLSPIGVQARRRRSQATENEQFVQLEGSSPVVVVPIVNPRDIMEANQSHPPAQLVAEVNDLMALLTKTKKRKKGRALTMKGFSHANILFTSKNYQNFITFPTNKEKALQTAFPPINGWTDPLSSLETEDTLPIYLPRGFIH